MCLALTLFRKSTLLAVILLLEHGKFEPAADIAKWSARGIESKVKTGDPVGRRP